MPDLDLERALAALPQQLAHERGPGAAAAISTVRRRRRRRAGAVALVAVAAVGAGLSAPRLLSTDEDGRDVATRGGSAPLDAGVLEEATAGWIEGWGTTEPGLPGQPSVGVATCFDPGRPAEPLTRGTSWFTAGVSTRATLTISRFPDDEAAEAALDQEHPEPGSCGTTTLIDVDGAGVRHDAMPRELAGLYLTDVWSVRLGAATAELEVATGSAPADAATARRVARALVAGLWSGSTQVPQTPELSTQLTSATTGWTGAWEVPLSQGDSRLRAFHSGCFELVGPGADAERAGSSLFVSRPAGAAAAFSMFADYGSADGAQDYAASFDDQMTACGATTSTEQRGGTVVVRGSVPAEGDEPAEFWLVVRGDRVGVLAVLGAGSPAPDAVGNTVTDLVVEAVEREASFVSPTYYPE